MTKISTTTPDYDLEHFDEVNYPRTETTEFEVLADKALSRRSFLGASLAFGASAFVMGAGVLRPAEAAGRIGFKQVAANTLDEITIPEGYNWNILASWGDPLWSKGPEFDPVTRGTGESQELSFGDNTDGMAVFDLGERTVIAINNEYVNRDIIYGNRSSGAPENADDVRKGKAGHGVSVIEIAEQDGKWSIVKDSPLNRRITADSPMDITGPAAGHDLMKTKADPTGTKSLGTWNNCGNGRTPWGTYLTCEENFNGYFSSSDENFAVPAELKRYGVGLKDWGYAWATTDERFDISKNPNEPNRAGYIVEIDPANPDATPKKRTALGRFKHENAEVVLADDGHVVVYMGDDERGEFMYKFISDGVYSAGGDNSDLLEDGRLFVAKYADDGKGEWVELTPASTGMASKAEICIHTRIAASAVGATTMDRPEWVAANPLKAEIYCALTNNKNRGKKPNAGGDETPVGGPNPREGNNYGQIVRLRPSGGDHNAAAFDWDLFVMAGNPTVHKDAYGGSENVNADNMFNSPDGLAFDSNGMLWIQTDGNYSNAKDFAGQGNNQMLLGDPATGEIRRFLVGPKECEITGITWSPDRRTMFVGVQHPGEKGGSHWPAGGDSVPRSSVIAIRRNDGGLIG
jgi:secreted PhoX family phosphatase